MRKIFGSLIIVFVFVVGTTSCFKEDNIITPHPADTTKVEMISLNQYYQKQVYFNLSSGKQVAENLKNDYDLMFSCADTGFSIKLNTSCFMKVAKTQYTTFEQVTDTVGMNWQFDASSGNPDSTVFKDWINITGSDTTYPQTVYVINRGIDDIGNNRGLRKVIFHKLENDKYYFSFCNMDNSEKQDFVIEKEPGYNTIQFSFDTKDTVQKEPLSNNWDLLFTQYTTMLKDDGKDYPYLVTGVLVNPNGTSVAFDSTMVFNNITIDDVFYLNFSENLDAIGYLWKKLYGNVNGGDFYYKTHLNYNYFVKNKAGIIFKMRFTGFYNPDTGEKGYPTFEYNKL